MVILVTGATGQLGSLVVDRLLELLPASNLAVSVRDVDKAKHFSEKGVDVRQGDFNNPETLEIAFAGVDRILIVSTTTEGNRVEKHRAAVNAAQKAGVKHIVYTSVVNAQESKADIATDHRATEDIIRESGIPYTFLRNNWYIENEAGNIQAALKGAPWVHTLASAKVGWATRRDYAHAAAAVLAGEGHKNKIYELSGELRTVEEVVEILKETLGKKVPLKNVSDDAYAEILRSARLSDTKIMKLVNMLKSIREGAMAVESDDLETLLGRAQQPLSEAVQAIAAGK
ncbi:SDR family oxidoreductase [Brevibacillus reuszeri]|uniref:SDR family oxidoreductase n=1 Tax=Brevibacillus reuszeri TaxID=54915 RepID=UPI003D204B49